MDVMLERILSLIPKKPDGKFVHGSKKDFADSLELPSNIVAEWVSGRNKSYPNYLYEIASKYGVSVEWLQGKTDEKSPQPLSVDLGHGEIKKLALDESELNSEILTLMERLNPKELDLVSAYIQGLLAAREGQSSPDK